MPLRPLATSYLIASSLCLLLFTGCTNTSPAVSFAVFGDPAEFAAYENLVAAFAEAHPNIVVELRHIPSQSDYRQRLATEFSAGISPDVMLLNYRRFAAFANQDVLEPLGPYLAGSTVIAEEDFFEIAINSFQYDGQLWCIPQNISSLVVYYNKDLFENAGISTPNNNWTRQQFLTAAQALTQDTNGDGSFDQYGVGLSPTLFRLAPFIWGDGGQIVDDLAQPTQLTLDSPAFQWFVDLQVKQQVVPDAVAESAQSSDSRFLTGTLAMMFNSRRGTPTYRTIDSFEWDVAPLPLAKKNGRLSLSKSGILHSDAYCLSAGAENKEAAWTFIEFANSVEGQIIVAASGRTVPSLKSVAVSDAFLNSALPPANSAVFVETVGFLGRVPVHPGWVGVEEAANKEIERAFYGQVSVAEAAKTASDITRRFWQE